MRACVRDGCGRGRNEFEGRVQKHHVHFSFQLLQKWPLLEIVKSQRDTKRLQVWTLCVAGYAKDAIVGFCYRTNDGQEHKISWFAGPERDTIFHLRVTACREQGSHCPVADPEGFP